MRNVDIGTMGIYMITNKLNGRRYIGKSSNIELRFRSHCVRPKRKWESTKQSKLSYDINKLGEENFTVSVLKKFESLKDYLQEGFYYEKYYMANLQPEYNIMFGCSGGGKTKGLNIEDDDYTLKARTNWNEQVEFFKSHYPTLDAYLAENSPTSTTGKLKELMLKEH